MVNSNYLFQVRVTGVLVEDEQLLLVKQDLGSRGWSLPGGRAQHGESLEEAMVREMLEETGRWSSCFTCARDPVQLRLYCTYHFYCARPVAS